MRRVAIRCEPRASVPEEEVEQWLEQEMGRLRGVAPRATLRLHRITAIESSGDGRAGWLIELDATGGGAPLPESSLDATLRDMRLLGLRPRLLTAPESDESPTMLGRAQMNRAET
jgi:hypothetical protein